MQRAWKVSIPLQDDDYYKYITTVFFDMECTKEYVKESLINHDGYPSNIIVTPT